MAISLGRSETVPITTLRGEGVFEVTGEKELKMESTPAGSEHLSVTVPAGEKWTVRATFMVTVTDV